MSTGDARMVPARPRRALALAGVALLLLGLYAFSAFGLSGARGILRFSSGVFDMDVLRVVRDWTTAQPSGRTSVHPLAKLALAPLGTGLRVGAGLAGLEAARGLAIAAVILHAVLVGLLASQLAGGARGPAVLAALLCGASFSSLLLASIPESASISGLSTLLPLLYLNRRWGRSFGWGEAVAWGLIGCLCIAITLTQLAHWLIALSVRVSLGRGASGRGAGRLRAARLAVLLGVFVALIGAASELQARLYPGTPRFYAREPVSAERAYLRLDDLREHPLSHGLRLAKHFLVTSFVAPTPGYSDFLMRDHGLDYWSLSIETPDTRDTPPWRQALLAVWTLLLLPAAVLVGRAERRFVAPLLAVASQFALHLLYGREYILYSANWHGPVVAMLVAAVWNGLGTAKRRWLPVVVGVVALSLAVNGLLVMRRVYAELEIGLESARRDAQGRPSAGPSPTRGP